MRVNKRMILLGLLISVLASGRTLVTAYAEAEEDITTGRVAPMENTFSDLRAMLKEKQNG